MKKRVNADEVVELWSRLGPAGGVATPHIPVESAPDLFAAFANAGAASLGAWSGEWARPLRSQPDGDRPSR